MPEQKYYRPQSREDYIADHTTQSGRWIGSTRRNPRGAGRRHKPGYLEDETRPEDRIIPPPEYRPKVETGSKGQRYCLKCGRYHEYGDNKHDSPTIAPDMGQTYRDKKTAMDEYKASQPPSDDSGQ